MKRLITITYTGDDDMTVTEGAILAEVLQILNGACAGNICIQTSEIPDTRCCWEFKANIKDIQVPDFLNTREKRGTA